MTKLRYTLECVNSRADVYGNRYYGFIYTDHESGKQVRAMISGGESNVNSIAYHMSGEQWVDDHIYTRYELPIREFNRLTKGWEYAGCRGDELAAYIKAKLAEQ